MDVLAELMLNGVAVAVVVIIGTLMSGLGPAAMRVRVGGLYAGRREVLLAAVKQNGQALENAAKLHKRDREIVLAAVMQNGYALGYAAPELQVRGRVRVAKPNPTHAHPNPNPRCRAPRRPSSRSRPTPRSPSTYTRTPAPRARARARRNGRLRPHRLSERRP